MIISLLRFRLWQLFLAIAVACGGLWLVTQAGMKTAEIEILQFDAVPINRFSGIELPDHQASMSGSADDTPDLIYELAKVQFSFREPMESRHETVSVFLTPMLTDEVFEVGQRLKFRYRASPILWLKAMNPVGSALEFLAIEQDCIEEIITESGDPTIEY
ncbi:MAG: hypothetical protein P8J27_13080 [Mariniblastus sp.]|nr:hypothetical protein [Mariniblastus sp.]